jgi:hypothetical protein
MFNFYFIEESSRETEIFQDIIYSENEFHPQLKFMNFYSMGEIANTNV